MRVHLFQLRLEDLGDGLAAGRDEIAGELGLEIGSIGDELEADLDAHQEQPPAAASLLLDPCSLIDAPATLGLPWTIRRGGFVHHEAHAPAMRFENESDLAAMFEHGLAGAFIPVKQALEIEPAFFGGHVGVGGEFA
jgi:hypothetical protein